MLQSQEEGYPSPGCGSVYALKHEGLKALETLINVRGVLCKGCPCIYVPAYLLGGHPAFTGKPLESVQGKDNEEEQDSLEEDEEEEADLGDECYVAVPVLAGGDDLVLRQVRDDPAPQVFRGGTHHVLIQGPILLPLEPRTQVEDVAVAIPGIPPQVSPVQALQVVQQPAGEGGELVVVEEDHTSGGAEGSREAAFGQPLRHAVDDVGTTLAG